MKRFNTITVFFYLLSAHLLGILFFTTFRIILFFCNFEQINGIENGIPLFLRAMLKGLQFDNLVASYITLFPLIVLCILSLLNKVPKIIFKYLTIYYSIIYAIAFGIAISDIPYFMYFLSHIKTDALGWLQFASVTTGMVFQEVSNYPFLVLYIVSIAGFYLIIRKIRKKLLFCETANKNKIKLKFQFPLVVFLTALCLIGMRGTFNRYPLRVGDAYFSSHSIFNQLGVNPTFSFLKSYQDVYKQKRNVNDLMPYDKAISLVKKELGANLSTNENPLYREIKPEGEPINANVVIILLESMAANCLKTESKGRNLTPYLNDLINKSYYFEHFFSSGVHTNNGIASTLYGYPALFDQPSMEPNPKHYTGIPLNLHNTGYQTLFFLTSNPQYDHMNSFLHENGFDRIYSQFDYPEEKVVNNFGVQDDYLFEYGLARLNEAALKNKPFLATFMTVSKHPPFVVPDAYKNIAEKDEDCILAFVDNSLKNFMEDASKQDWFQNTFFIILGDHGTISGKQDYAMALSYNHIPCIIYSPLLTDTPKRFSQYGGQIDLFPTVMGLLNRSYTNDSFGIDLLKEERPCMFFASNNQLGCIDDNYFYVRDLDIDTDLLYDLRSGQLDNRMEKQPEIAEKLKEYAVSMMVSAYFLIKSKK